MSNKSGFTSGEIRVNNKKGKKIIIVCCVPRCSLQILPHAIVHSEKRRESTWVILIIRMECSLNSTAHRIKKVHAYVLNKNIKVHINTEKNIHKVCGKKDSKNEKVFVWV